MVLKESALDGGALEATRYLVYSYAVGSAIGNGCAWHATPNVAAQAVYSLAPG